MGRSGVFLLGFVFLLPLPAVAEHVLHRPIPSEPESLDPAKSSSDTSDQVEGDLFEGLVALDPDENVIPAVAERWELAEDGVTYTFHLRPTARWSNGEPLTAEDFVYAWRRVIDPATGSAGLDPVNLLANAQEIGRGAIKDLSKLGVEAVDTHTLRVTTAKPSPLFLKQCSFRYAYPLHRATVEKWGKAWTQPEHIVSNGPFALKSWIPLGSIVLTRSETYWDRRSIRLGEVDYLQTENDEVGLKQFLAGELDFAEAPTRDIASARRAYGAALHTGQSKTIDNFGFNMKKGQFAGNQALRQALALAYDPSIIVNKLEQRGAQVSYSWVPPSMPDYTNQRIFYADMPMTERLARARQLYAEAGYGPDHPLKLTINYAKKEDRRIAVLAAAQMWKAALGVETTLEAEEFQVFLQRVKLGDFELAVVGLTADTRDPESYLSRFGTDDPLNRFHYSNPQVDSLLTAAATTIDRDRRNGLYQQAERIVADDVPGMPTQFNSINILVSPRLVGWRDNEEFPPSRALSFGE